MILFQIIALGFIVGAAWAVFKGARLLGALQQKSLARAFWCMMILTAGIGVYLGVFFEFQLSSRFGMQGIPIPLKLMEEGYLASFFKSAWSLWLCRIGNVCFPVSLMAALWVFWLQRLEKRKKRE